MSVGFGYREKPKHVPTVSGHKVGRWTEEKTLAQPCILVHVIFFITILAIPIKCVFSWTVEFSYNSLFSAKSWQNPAIDREEQIKKNCPSRD